MDDEHYHAVHPEQYSNVGQCLPCKKLVSGHTNCVQQAIGNVAFHCFFLQNFDMGGKLHLFKDTLNVLGHFNCLKLTKNPKIVSGHKNYVQQAIGNLAFHCFFSSKFQYGWQIKDTLNVSGHFNCLFN